MRNCACGHHGAILSKKVELAEPCRTRGSSSGAGKVPRDVGRAVLPGDCSAPRLVPDSRRSFARDVQVRPPTPPPDFVTKEVDAALLASTTRIIAEGSGKSE